MTRIALACAALAAILGGAPAAAQPTESEAARATEFDGLRLLGTQDPDRRLSRLGIYMAYVTSDTRPSDGMYLCGGMSRDEALSAATTVSSALQNLPDAVLSRLRLKYVVLCSQALAAGQSIGGIPVPPLDLLMLSAAGDSGSLQHRTLHELYHLLEYRSGGIGDADWSSQFGAGYSNRYPGLLRKAPLGSGKPGFVSAYGETHPHEDRAELFAYLVLSPREVADLIRRTGDSVLRQKAHYLGDKCQRVIGLSIALPP